MLENIRSNSSGIVAWGIALLIIVTMAFFGVSSYVSPQAYGVVAEVGDRSISEEAFRREFQNWQRATRQRMGQNAQIDLDSDFFKLQTLDRMINQQLVAEISDKENYQVGDKQVADLIRNSPEFQTDGKFDAEKYTNITDNYGSKRAYEVNLRDNLTNRQVLSGLADSGFVLPNKLNDVIALQTQRREFDLVRFSVSEYAKDIPVSDEEVQANYEANIDAYKQDEQVAVQYIRFKAQDLEDQVELSEEDLRLAYEQDQQTALSDASRQVRHILLSGDDAKAQANAALERINQGESFADLAKELSQDPGSAANGGDLGTVERGQMVKPFEDSAFSLELNQVSEPVKSQFGYHIIEVTAINVAETKPFDDVRADLEKSERQRRAEELFFEQVEQLKNLVYENSDSLQAAADELSLTIEKTPLFTRFSGEGIAANQRVRDAAFLDDVLFNGLNSDAIELSPTDYVAIRKEQYIESKPKPLAEVKSQIVDQLRAEKAVEVIAEASKQALNALNEANDWNKMVEKQSLTAESVSFSYADESNTLPAELLNAVFSASPASAEAKSGIATDAEGNAFLFQLNDVVAASESEKNDAIKDASERLFLARESGSAFVQRFLQDKREALGVEINQDLL